jgi:hypothetical protein
VYTGSITKLILHFSIHGSGAVSKYVNLSPNFKNPSDTGSKQGAKITIDNTAKWNSDM